MKHNIKLFMTALIIGIVASFIFCNYVDTTFLVNALNTKGTGFIVGTYNNIEEAKKRQNQVNHSILYEEDGIYKVMVGIYTKKESIALMESYFIDQNISFRKDSVKVTSEFMKQASNYESLIVASDSSYYDNLNEKLLTLFLEYKK